MIRVLDLGCHDGFLGAWLRERFDGDLTIDGVELHADACARARRRGYRKVVQGRAEDAPDLLAGERYDIVVLYEVIEHVPDMDALLAAAEGMLVDGGQIYVSTPDGTFDQGRNPHHLRALRTIDLADLLRRRGRLVDVEVGQDGIATAAYTPGPRMGEIAIFTGPGLNTWSPLDIVKGGLGGSETAAVRVANELSDLGYILTVYGSVEQGCYMNVVYRDWQVFDPTVERDAVIASRLPEVFDMPLNAKCKLLWLHDVDVGDRLTPARADRLDHVLTLSSWHTGHVHDVYPFLNGKVKQTRNGVDLKRFSGPPPDRHRRVVYSSSPDRGLDILLELWPRVREQVPDAELHHAYPPYFDMLAAQRPELETLRRRLADLRDQPGVEMLGSLSQPQLAELLRSSMVWAHPSWASPYEGPFCETSCIGAMEAQAAGCVVVASSWGALPETVAFGLLVDELDAPGEAWRDQFVENLVRALTDEDPQAQARIQGPAHASQLGWGEVARDLRALIDPLTFDVDRVPEVA